MSNDEIELSNQAKWYLSGQFPLYEILYGHSKPEPKAMQELVDQGLIVKCTDSITGNPYWSLTKLGWKIRSKLKERTY